MLIQSMTPSEIATEATSEFKKYLDIALKTYQGRLTIRKFKTSKGNNLKIVIGNKHAFYGYFWYETNQGRQLIIVDFLDKGVKLSAGYHLYILSPHFIQRFQERFKDCNFDAVPKRFMNELYEGRIIDEETIMARSGVYYCISYDNVHVFKTFLHYEMLSHSQSIKLSEKIDKAIEEYASL